MNILCLNVQNGGGAPSRSRWDKILAYADAHLPDIVVFTEWRAGRPLVVNWASARGMTCVEACEGSTKNGLFIASKPSFSTSSATPRHTCPGTLTLARYTGWSMLACYFPQNDKLAKGRYFDACHRITSEFANRPFLLLGDLNTGNQKLDKSPGGTPFFCADRFDELSASCGLVDLWRRSNDADALRWTWHSASGPKNGFRIDHAFGNPKFVERFRPFCRYDHQPRNDGFSDHSALLISTLDQA